MSNYRSITLEHYANMFKALSNPHRLEIFLRLLMCCPPGSKGATVEEARRYVGELGAELDIAPSTVSHHIKELRQAGLIVVKRRGKNIECWANEEAVQAIRELIQTGVPDHGTDKAFKARSASE